MDDQIEQILKSQHKAGEKISLAYLRHKPKKDNLNDIDEETLNKLQQLKKFALHNDAITSDKIFCYYCSLCGRINLICNSLVENMPRRTTDNAISIDLKANFLKINLHRDRLRYIRRQGGIEYHYRWKCQCGLPIAYTSIGYDQFQEARLEQNKSTSNKPYFYVYSQALVQKMKESKLISQLITYKETILLHLKRKTKK